MNEINSYKSIIKSINENVIRQEIQKSCPVTKTELVRITSLSFPTVSRIVDELESTGELLPAGLDDSTGGRRAQAYSVNPDYAVSLSMYFERSALRCLISNVVGERIGQSEYQLQHEDDIQELDQPLDSLLKAHPNIRSIAIGVPSGVSDGVIRFTHGHDRLADVNLKKHIREKYGVRARIENDMSCMAYGCYMRLFHDRSTSLVCIYIGEKGIGCGACINGGVLTGEGGFLGEIGYMPVSGPRNLGELISDGFRGADRVDCFARLLTNICIFLNPATIVFYESRYVRDMEQIRERCQNYLPALAMPVILTSDEHQNDYENGLVAFGTQLISAGFKIENEYTEE
ncbi:MAG: ROK family protein [Clostridia bacterium]|nr:ROK family protein [Clostridia bacterium]MDR3644855.1 ROK family protein [Clostridia bacterium]